MPSLISVDGRDYKGTSDAHYFTLQSGKRVSMTEYEKKLVQEFKSRRGF